MDDSGRSGASFQRRFCLGSPADAATELEIDTVTLKISEVHSQYNKIK